MFCSFVLICASGLGTGRSERDRATPNRFPSIRFRVVLGWTYLAAVTRSEELKGMVVVVVVVGGDSVASAAESGDCHNSLVGA